MDVCRVVSATAQARGRCKSEDSRDSAHLEQVNQALAQSASSQTALDSECFLCPTVSQSSEGLISERGSRVVITAMESDVACGTGGADVLLAGRDADMALQHMRTSVLGSKHGTWGRSRSRSSSKRRCVLVVSPSDNHLSPSRVPAESGRELGLQLLRSTALGSRLGTPRRGRHCVKMDLLPTLADPSSLRRCKANSSPVHRMTTTESGTSFASRRMDILGSRSGTPLRYHEFSDHSNAARARSTGLAPASAPGKLPRNPGIEVQRLAEAEALDAARARLASPSPFRGGSWGGALAQLDAEANDCYCTWIAVEARERDSKPDCPRVDIIAPAYPASPPSAASARVLPEFSPFPGTPSSTRSEGPAQSAGRAPGLHSENMRGLRKATSDKEQVHSPLGIALPPLLKGPHCAHAPQHQGSSNGRADAACRSGDSLSPPPRVPGSDQGIGLSEAASAGEHHSSGLCASQGPSCGPRRDAAPPDNASASPETDCAGLPGISLEQEQGLSPQALTPRRSRRGILSRSMSHFERAKTSNRMTWLPSQNFREREFGSKEMQSGGRRLSRSNDSSPAQSCSTIDVAESSNLFLQALVMSPKKVRMATRLGPRGSSMQRRLSRLWDSGSLGARMTLDAMSSSYYEK